MRFLYLILSYDLMTDGLACLEWSRLLRVKAVDHDALEHGGHLAVATPDKSIPRAKRPTHCTAHGGGGLSLASAFALPS